MGSLVAPEGGVALSMLVAVLFGSGYLREFEVPVWVTLAAAVAIGLGTCEDAMQQYLDRNADHEADSI